jgi:hypothetical protein
MTLGLVAPFFRASVEIGPAERAIFVRALPEPLLLENVRAASPILRQNLRRLFAAACLAQATGAALALVEGFRSNRIVSRRGPKDRFVTGSWLFEALFRALLRRRLLPPAVSFRLDRSRCTLEEASAIASLARSLGCENDVVGVSDEPCPSPSRAVRYLSRELGAGAVVLTPQQAFARASVPLSAAQAAFWEALAPRPRERWLAPIVEAPNWGLHFLSEGLGRAAAVSMPFEQRLARLLRRDR